MHLFEDANLCAIHARRVTIMVKDIQVCAPSILSLRDGLLLYCILRSLFMITFFQYNDNLCFHTLALSACTKDSWPQWRSWLSTISLTSSLIFVCVCVCVCVYVCFLCVCVAVVHVCCCWKTLVLRALARVGGGEIVTVRVRVVERKAKMLSFDECECGRHLQEGKPQEIGSSMLQWGL